MLNGLQKQQLEQSHLHEVLRNKGVLDNDLMREMETWRQILINSLQKNDYLDQRKEYYKGEVLRLMTEKNGLSTRIINHRMERQDLNRQIEGLNTTINDLEADLDTNDELLANKNQQISALISKLANAETERDNYLNELNELDTDFRSQDELLAEKNTKLAQVIKERDDLKIQLTQEQQMQKETQQKEQEIINNQTAINKLIKQLIEKDKLIQQQVQRIKELENKPSVQTKNKEVKVETKYPVETIVEVTSEAQKKEIISLKQNIEHLKQQLSQKLVPNQIIVKDNLPRNPKTGAIFLEKETYWIIGSGVVILFLIVLSIVSWKRKKV